MLEGPVIDDEDALRELLDRAAGHLTSPLSPTSQNPTYPMNAPAALAT
jgi:hypothetical protein